MKPKLNLAMLLSFVSNIASVVVFLAFELESPLVIFETLVGMDIRGKLLDWAQAYYRNRSAKVWFKGCHSKC